MKLFTGWLIMPAVAAITATGAQAQVPALYEIDQPAVVVSDLPGPYAAVPPGPVEDGGPRLLPMTEVYTVVREGDSRRSERHGSAVSFTPSLLSAPMAMAAG